MFTRILHDSSTTSESNTQWRFVWVGISGWFLPAEQKMVGVQTKEDSITAETEIYHLFP